MENLNQWFYELNNQQQDPINDDAIKSLLEDGTLTGSSLVWKQGFEQWIPIKDTELAVYLPVSPPPFESSITPPPIPKSNEKANQSEHYENAKISNVAVWFLAFAPIIGGILEGIFAIMLNGGNEYRAARGLETGYYFFVTIALNVFLGYVDAHGLKRYNVDFDNSWFIPTYLYHRAVKFNHSQAYTIVWCVCFTIYIYAWFIE